MNIRTERLLLRELEPQDAGAIYRIESQPEMARYQYFSERTPESSKSYVQSAIEAQSQRPRVYYELGILIEQNTLIGRIGCIVEEIVARLWYVVDQPHQRKGFATEAAKAFVSAIAAETGVRHFEIECDPRNVPSWKLAESLGFHLVREIPNSFEIKGEICSSREYRLSL